MNLFAGFTRRDWVIYFACVIIALGAVVLGTVKFYHDNPDLKPHLRGAGVVSSGEDEYESKRLEAVVSDWVGVPSAVYCSPMPKGLYGWAMPDLYELHINRRFCQPIFALMGGKEILQRRTADGILTIAHEAHHLTGDFDEKHTECVAMQTTDEWALKLGASPRWAHVLHRTAYRLSMEFQAEAPDYRDWKRCREDGRWDLTPGDGIWP